MNRRIKNKIQKKENLKKQHDILDKIKKNFTVENENFGNGYYIFYMGLNSVCHFSIKETPEWLYGIWLDKNGFEIFGHPIDMLDKFKPSQTYISLGSDLEKFIEKVQNIVRNPKLYYVDALTSGKVFKAYEKVDYGEDSWYEGYQAIEEYDKETDTWSYRKDESITQEQFVNEKYAQFKELKEKQKKNHEEDRVYAFNFFKELPNTFNEIIAVGVIDGNKGGMRVSPRYNLRVVIDPLTNQERANELYKEIDDLVWDKNSLDRKQSFEHQFSFYDLYDSVKEIKYCDYFFYREGVNRKKIA